MSIQRLVPLALAGVLAQAPGFAQDDVTVFSARADSVAVTIYPDDLALITETRTVELPASAATLVIQDVADTLLSQSAVVNGLERLLAESNFDFNRLSPQSLITHAIGQTVTLIRTNPATGVVTRMPATLVAAGEGVVLETEDGNEALYCAALPEGLVFDAIPDDLYATPQLSMRLAAGDPGEQTIQVSYLAHGFTWSADYVAQLDAEAERLDLTGWATVRNSSSKVFDQVELQLVAGQLNVLANEDGGSRAVRVEAALRESQVDARARLAEESAVADATLLRDCFEAEVPVFERRRTDAEPLFETVVVTGARIAPREEFGDYHLYRLPWRTDIGARQTKQVRFLEQDDVTVDRFYRLYVTDIGYPAIFGRPLELFVDESDGSEAIAAPPSIILRTENTTRAGLGEPLPAGMLRLFEASRAGSVFVGQTSIRDRPVGAEVELEMGRALDILVESEFQVDGNRRERLAADYRAINRKTQPIDFEIRHFVSPVTDLTVEESSRSYELTGDSITWRFTVPPGAETLSYRLSASE